MPACPGEHIAAQSQHRHPWLAAWEISQALHHILCPAKDMSLCVLRLGDLHTPEKPAALVCQIKQSTDRVWYFRSATRACLLYILERPLGPDWQVQTLATKLHDINIVKWCCAVLPVGKIGQDSCLPRILDCLARY